MRALLLALMVLSGFVLPSSAAAQATPVPPPSGAPGPLRWFTYVGGGYQMTTSEFNGAGSFDASGEAARFDGSYAVGRGSTFKVSGGVMLTGHIGVGGGLTRASGETEAALTTQIPHPFFFARPRAVGGTATGLARQETTVDLHVSGTLSLGPRLQATVFGGPSLFRVQQDLVTVVTYTEQYPYDEASFKGATSEVVTGSKAGISAGGGVTYVLTRHLGVGLEAQFSRATVELSAPALSVTSVTAGGGLVTVGLRARF